MLDQAFLQRAVSQMMTIWVNPEIERRRERGVVPPDFRLRRAQVVFPSPLDDTRSYVRLNDEVRLQLLVKPRKHFQLGDVFSSDDIQAVERARLPAPESDCAHISLIRVGRSWYFFFDLTYNRERALDHLMAGRDFLAVADAAVAQGRLRPACDLLFSAAELLAKAELMLIPGPSMDSHTHIRVKYHAWAKLGNVPAQSASILKQLTRAREAGRYFKGPFRFPASQIKRCREGLEANVRRLEERLRV